MNSVCVTCGISKPLTDFPKSPTNRSGYRSTCKKCYKRRKENSRLQKEYGMTIEDVEAILIEQNHKCGICREPIDIGEGRKRRSSNVDHDHKTGKFRSILCFRCNVALGMAGENIRRLQKCIAYIRFHTGVTPADVYFRKAA